MLLNASSGMSKRDGSCVTVANAGRNVEGDVLRVGQMHQWGPFAVSCGNLLGIIRRATQSIPHILSEFPLRVLHVPRRQIADADPRARRRPHIRMTPGHQHRHMSTARVARQIDPISVDRVRLLHPRHRIYNVPPGQIRPQRFGMVVSAPEIRPQVKPSLLGNRRFEVLIVRLEVSAPRVKRHDKRKRIAIRIEPRWKNQKRWLLGSIKGTRDRNFLANWKRYVLCA